MPNLLWFLIPPSFHNFSCLNVRSEPTLTHVSRVILPVFSSPFRVSFVVASYKISVECQCLKKMRCGDEVAYRWQRHLQTGHHSRFKGKDKNKRQSGKETMFIQTIKIQYKSSWKMVKPCQFITCARLFYLFLFSVIVRCGFMWTVVGIVFPSIDVWKFL